MEVLNKESLHDVEIMSIHADSLNSYFDTISIVLKDDRFISSYGHDKIKLLFINSYQVILRLNTFIEGNESVRLCTITKEKVQITDSLSKEFDHFRMETNISASTIDIIVPTIKTMTD